MLAPAIVGVRRSGLAETAFYLEGTPFSLQDYPFYRDVYDGGWPLVLLKCGRQVAKTTTGHNLILADSMCMPYFKTLYVAPTQKQAGGFSRRLQKAIYYSPDVKDHFLDAQCLQNQWTRQLSNGSEVNVVYAKDDPDRIRSLSSDRNIYDEIQDMNLPTVRPVVDECMANSEYGWTLLAGTPKSMENGIESLWGFSTQSEWCIPCEGCNAWNFVESADSIGKRGVICVKCGKYLNTRSPRAMWIDRRESDLKGFHVPQLILPRNNEPNIDGEYARWNRILFKYEDPMYPESKFKQEVLGVSDAIGTRMVSKDDLLQLCKPYRFSAKPTPEILDQVTLVVAGVDWSGGGSAHYTSRTAIHVWGLLPDGRLKTLFYHIFPTGNAYDDIDEVAAICRKFEVKMVVGDAGGGAASNSGLMQKLGRWRVAQAQYGALPSLVKWNRRDRYMVDKTAAIDTMMLRYKNGGVIFAEPSQMEAAMNDILAEYEEITQYGQGRKIWTNSSLTPDDALHAQVFGWLAMEIALGNVNFYDADYTAEADFDEAS